MRSALTPTNVQPISKNIYVGPNRSILLLVPAMVSAVVKKKEGELVIGFVIERREVIVLLQRLFPPLLGVLARDFFLKRPWA